MIPSTEIKKEKSSKVLCECLFPKTQEKKGLVSKELSKVAIIIFGELFPELISRCNRMKASTEIKKINALVYHQELEDFFKKIIHAYQKHKIICPYLPLNVLHIHNEHERAINLIHIFNMPTVSVQEYVEIEKIVWVNSLTKIFKINDIALSRDIIKFDCIDFVLPHKPENCLFGEKFIILKPLEKQIDRFNEIFKVYSQLINGSSCQKSIFYQSPKHLLKHIWFSLITSN